MFQPLVYTNRRQQLKELVGNGMLLFLGNGESPINYADNTYRFRQDSSFLYFFGIDLPDVDAIINIDDDSTVLFADDADINTIIWTGVQEPMREKALRAGITEVKPRAALLDYINKVKSKHQPIRFLPPYRAETKLRLSNLLNLSTTSIDDLACPLLINACICLREIKEACEIDEIEAQMAIAFQMHTTAMRMAHPGIKESQIAAAVEAIALASGGSTAFPIICSIRGETLHNHKHVNTLKSGDILLVDAGCESPLHYATDHTRTSPVGGRFSSLQKDVYQIVLDANNAVTNAIAPNVPYIDLHLLAAVKITEGLKQLGLMKGDVSDAVAAGAHTLFFPHGIGHMMGLDVHDMEAYKDTLVGYDNEFTRSTQFGFRSLRLGKRLKPGFVVTNEPGIYFIPELIDLWMGQRTCADYIHYDKLNAFKGFGGIRLEDDILVTETGSRLLGQRIPITPDEVEQTVLSGK